MEVHFAPDLQDRLSRAAAENNSGVDEYVQQLVEHYVEHDVWFREQVKQGVAQLDRGECVSHENVGARLAKLLRS